ncbi:MAG TPA: GYD domain-containing protein [Paracoccaceae bacterium]|nr:GYD domain-containing protein [Paracoccaceae bacterium]
MPFYLYQCSYSREAIKAMIAKPQDRREVADKLIQSVGGKLHQFFLAFGSNDVVAIFEAPDDKAMAAVSMLVAGAGTVAHGATTKLITMEEAMEAFATAGKASAGYKPPMG